MIEKHYNKPLKKSLGQHFLSDDFVLLSLLKCISPKESDVFLEIGPGSGALTRILAPECKRMILIEKDKDCADFLAQVDFLSPKSSSVEIINQDFLQVVGKVCQSLQAPIRWVGNLPYNVGSQILIALIECRPWMIDGHFMLQKEVAMRCLAKPGSKQYGRLSVVIQTYFFVDHSLDVGPESFSPPPKVDSSVIRLIPIPESDLGQLSDRYHEVIALAFAQRRKTLKQSLKSMVVAEFWEALPKVASQRAEQMSVESFKVLASHIEAFLKK